MLELVISNWLARSLILLVLFALVVAGAVYAINWASRRRVAVRQLARIGAHEKAEFSNSVLEQEREGRWARIANAIEKSGINLTDTGNDKLQKSLKAAGYRGAAAPRVYTLLRIVLVFLLPGLFLFVVATSAEPPSVGKIYLISAVAALLGFFLPALVVQAKADRRRTAIINGFPDSLDLLLVCVEAGLGLEAAMDRVGREIATTHPLVSELFTETTLMMRAGASREDAMRRMSENAGVDEIRSFATLLIQSDKLGTSISTTLRIYAAEMREARRMRAEEKAHRLPVLISIPLVACMLPTMIGVLILPAAVSVVREVLPAMTGG